MLVAPGVPRGTPRAAPRPRASGRRPGVALPEVRPARSATRAPAPLPRPAHLSAGQRTDAGRSRSTMAVGLEARVPLLDRQLIGTAFSLPPEAAPARLDQGRLSRSDRAVDSPRRSCGARSPASRPVQEVGRRRKPRGRVPLPEIRRLAADGLIRPRSSARLVTRGTQRRNNKVWLLAEPRSLVPKVDPGQKADR